MKVGDDVLHRQGFDRFFGHIGQRRAHSYWPEFLFESTGDSHQRVPLAGNRVDDTAQQATHDYLYGEFRGRQAARRRAWKAARLDWGQDDGTLQPRHRLHRVVQRGRRAPRHRRAADGPDGRGPHTFEWRTVNGRRILPLECKHEFLANA